MRNNKITSREYQFKFSYGFRILILLFAASIVGMACFSTSYDLLSPFIDNPQSLLSEHAQWAHDCGIATVEKRGFFICDAFFALFVFFLAKGVFDAVFLRTPLSKNKFRYCFKLSNPIECFYEGLFIKQKKCISKRNNLRCQIFFTVVIFLACIFDWWEGYLFCKNYDIGRHSLLVGINCGKTALYGLFISILLFVIIYQFINDRYNVSENFGEGIVFGIWRFVKYFYPAIINILVFLYVMRVFNTFDSVLLDMLGSWNFPLFVVLFGFSLLTVWLLPYYLRFSSSFYTQFYNSEKAEGASKGKDKKFYDYFLGKHNLIFPIRKLGDFFKSLNETPQKTKSFFQEPLYSIGWIYNLGEIQKDKNTVKEIDECIAGNNYKERTFNHFHFIRRAFAIVFILTLLILEGELLNNLLQKGFIASGITGAAVLLLFYYLTFYQDNFVEKDDKFFLNTGHLKLYRWLIRINIVLTILLCLLPILSPNEMNRWDVLLVLLVVNSFLLLFSFTGFALYRRIGGKHKMHEKDKYIEEQYKEWNRVSLTFILPVFIALSLFLLLAVFIIALVEPNCLVYLNPINFFLIFLNGIIVFIAVADRYLTLKKGRMVKNGNSEKFGIFKRKTIRALSVVGIFITFLIATCNHENKYHDIDYYRVSKKEKDSVLSIEKYTEKFLKKDSTKPIVLIAAEGGGLRAVYWTLLVMNQLNNNIGKEFFDNTYLVTGVSGGGVGLSMYNYMLEKGSLITATNSIAKIGDANFLTGDLAGIFGRGFVANMLKVLDLSGWEDRSESMARHYFHLAGEENYDEFKGKPFYSLWTENDYDLPLLAINTAQTENGRRGLVYPLKDFNDNSSFYINLTENFKGEVISYPNAAFLTNRFPFASPAGRIEGKGHFVDGGYLENSGLNTVLYFLQKISTSLDSVSYSQLKKRKIIVVSISNDKQSYIEEYFDREQASDFRKKVNKIFSQREIGSVLGATSSDGTNSWPIYYKELFSHPQFQNTHCLENSIDFIQIRLPFLFTEEEVHKTFLGQIPDCSISDVVRNNKTQINEMCNGNNELKIFDSLAVNAPPLGRLLTKNTRVYMDSMLNHPKVVGQIEKLEDYFRRKQNRRLNQNKFE